MGWVSSRARGPSAVPAGETPWTGAALTGRVISGPPTRASATPSVKRGRGVVSHQSPRPPSVRRPQCPAQAGAAVLWCPCRSSAHTEAQRFRCGPQATHPVKEGPTVQAGVSATDLGSHPTPHRCFWGALGHTGVIRKGPL